MCRERTGSPEHAGSSRCVCDDHATLSALLKRLLVWLPVVPGHLAVVPPAGRRWVLQAPQFDGHLLQGGSLGLTLTGEQLRLEDTKQDEEESITRHEEDMQDLEKIKSAGQSVNR